MNIAWRHRWDLTPAEARQLQDDARHRVILHDGSRSARLPRTIVAVDVGYDMTTDTCAASLIVWDSRRHCIVDQAGLVRPSTFPYVPGLLSFREIPPLLPLFDALTLTPELVLCDGQGSAHPRRMGLATHLGLVLDCPTLGWAKSRLIGNHKEPGVEAGSAAALMDGKEKIGWVLRSRANCRPTFVSPGHRMSMRRSLTLARALLGNHRLCEAARAAHRLTRELQGKRSP